MALDTNNSSWYRLSMQGPSPHQRDSWQAASDKQGKVYLYGGCYNINCTASNATMFTFDTTHYSWTTTVQSNPPNFQLYYSATMLSDGRIIYIGGTNYNTISSRNVLSIISLFITKSRCMISFSCKHITPLVISCAKRI